MGNTGSIRLVKESDATAVLDIYSRYVRDTVVSFEYEVPDPAAYVQRISTVTSQFPWLVFVSGNGLSGFAYASAHRQRTAYQWSCEASIYITDGFQGKGIGRLLYQTLFSILRLQGYVNVYAGVSLPNDKSVAFHLAMGFGKVGVYQKVGYKSGGWHDVEWFQLALQEHMSTPAIPQAIGALQGTDAFDRILDTARNAAGMVSLP